MKKFSRTNKPKTTLSVSPDSITLCIGTDLDERKLKPFLDILDGIIDSKDAKEYHGHFTFSKNKVEITLSVNRDEPNEFDLTYRYDL